MMGSVDGLRTKIFKNVISFGFQISQILIEESWKLVLLNLFVLHIFIEGAVKFLVHKRTYYQNGSSALKIGNCFTQL